VAAWAVYKAPGPLWACFLRIKARRGHQVIAVARKFAVLCWHLLTKETDYLWQRLALVVNIVRAMELPAGQPTKKDNKRSPAYAYNVKEVRNRKVEIAHQVEHACKQFLEHGQPCGPGKQCTGTALEERR
jgi:transposase